MNEVKNDESERSEAEQLEPVVIKPIVIDIPDWHDVAELAEDLERSDRTIHQNWLSGGELTPLQRVIHNYEDANPEGAKRFRKDIKDLVEWCLNHKDQVISKHEAL